MIISPAIAALDLVAIREALEACWSSATSYGGVWQDGNPALGQCYPTSRVVQHFLPASEIARGTVWTGVANETHFWNVLLIDGCSVAIDLTWQQFPHGSIVRSYEILDRNKLGDSPATVARCESLLARVMEHLATERVRGADNTRLNRR